MPWTQETGMRSPWTEGQDVRLARGHTILAFDVAKISQLDQPISELTGGSRSSWSPPEDAADRTWTTEVAP